MKRVEKVFKVFILYLFVSLLLISFTVGSFLVKADDSVQTVLPQEDNFTHFSSSSYILLEPTSNTVLVRKNENERMEVASIVKLMTTLLTFEAIENGVFSLDKEIIASEYACSMEGSQAFLDEGSKYKLSELLKSVVMASANDSAVALAETISGSESAFVRQMNTRAQELGMVNTLYANSTGLPEANQYSTALDTAKILYEVSKYPIYHEYGSIWMDSLIHPSGRETELVNTNRLIKYYSNCKIGKTGFTDEAKYCLSSMAEQDGFKLIAVTLGCKSASSRFNESMDLYRYGFANFEDVKVVGAGDIVKTINVSKGKQDTAILVASEEFRLVNKKGDKTSFEVRYEGPDRISAPLAEGDEIGKAIVLQKGKILGEITLVAVENVEEYSYRDALRKINDRWGFTFKNR